jgi:hypothetical protein
MEAPQNPAGPFAPQPEEYGSPQRREEFIAVLEAADQGLGGGVLPD